MRALLAVAAGLTAFTTLERRSRRLAGVAAGAGAVLVVAPPAGAALGAALLALLARSRLRARRRAAEEAEDDVALLADLTALGLRAGLGLIQALDRAAADVSPALADEVRTVVRAAGRGGTAAALTAAGGHAERLYRLAARAAATGAPVADAVDGYAAERRHADHARAAAEARRLPVRMLLPLALLILPGFVALAVGPALLEALDRLQLAP
jgi:pilus assembly protein TadC